MPVLFGTLVDPGVPWGTRALVMILWILCLIPSFIYVRQDPRTRRPLPFFPVLNLVFGVYYLLPMVLGVVDNYYNAPVYPGTDYDYPVQLVFLGWTTMILGYLVSAIILGPGSRPRAIPLKSHVLARWGFFLMFGCLALTAMRSLFVSASMMGGMFQFVLSLQWLGTGLLIVLARHGELSRVKKFWLAVGFTLSVGTMLANGNIAPMVLFFAVCAFAMWVAQPYFRPRWIVGAVLAILLATSFRGIVSDFRRAAFASQTRLSQLETLEMMAALLGTRISQQGLDAAIAQGVATSAGRSAILDLFAYVVRRTPSEVPHLKGSTYLSLVGSFMPRVLWPEKPTKELGQAFGHRYALLHSSNKSTAINLPILVEFFVNFGGAGVVLGMLIVGAVYRVLDGFLNRPGQSTVLSMIGVVVLLPLLLMESDLSLVMGGLPLTGAAFAVVWWQMRKSLGSGTATGSAARSRTFQLGHTARPALPPGGRA